MKISAEGRTLEFPAGTRFQEAAEAFQKDYDCDILLAQSGSRLYELHRRIPQEDMEVHFVTLRDEIGLMTYQRTAIFMMLKGFHEVLGKPNGIHVVVDYTLGGGFYCYMEGEQQPTAELLQQVKAKMQGYTAARLPIEKESVSTEEAVRFFRACKMHEKEHLFHYRMTSRVNLYALGEFKDYFYGYMADNTGSIRLYDLLPYGHGFILLLPTPKAPDRLPAFKPMDKLYEVQRSSSMWARSIGCSCIAALNDQIVAGKTDELILMQEAIFEKTIGNIAQRVANEKKKLIMIAGPSSSGKTTFSKRLSIQLQALGLHPHAISVDNYFRNRSETPRNEKGEYDFESIDCVDLPQFNTDMLRLLAGEEVELPRYNFLTGMREYKGERLRLKEDDILVIEGIHCLNDKMSYALPDSAKFRIYISALTQLNVDEHNRIPSSDARLLRRMTRDNRTRGNSAESTILMWKNVRKGEEENIFPYQERADVMVNSAMIYELPVLKIYAQPLLFQIREDSPAYQEAKRLLKFLDYVLPISPERIPQTSIVREFIGGSCLDVG